MISYTGKLCKVCKKPSTKDEHDPCIPNLPGVKNACCGHGDLEGYVMFDSGKVIRGTFDHVKSGMAVISKRNGKIGIVNDGIRVQLTPKQWVDLALKAQEIKRSKK